MIAEVVVPPWWLGGALHSVPSEDARELQLRIVVFANGSADLHCSPGEDLDLGVEIFFLSPRKAEKNQSVGHVIS